MRTIESDTLNFFYKDSVKSSGDYIKPSSRNTRRLPLTLQSPNKRTRKHFDSSTWLDCENIISSHLSISLLLPAGSPSSMLWHPRHSSGGSD
jgi:hypothetical protein